MDAKEKSVVDEMYQRLTGAFGVTVQGRFVTVRWGDKLKQVTMVVTNVDTGEPRCDLCGGPNAKHKTTTTTKLCGSSEYTYNVSLCGDCYCPK